MTGKRKSTTFTIQWAALAWTVVALVVGFASLVAIGYAPTWLQVIVRTFGFGVICVWAYRQMVTK